MKYFLMSFFSIVVILLAAQNSKENNDANSFKKYYEDGKIQVKGNLNKGVSVGKWVYYYPNGNIRMTGKFKKIKNIQNDESCKKYVNSVKFGVWKEYYENGKLKSIGSFTSDFSCKIITEKENDEELGLILMKKVEIDNFKNNKWKYYNKYGILIKEEFWKNGILKETKEYDEEGNLIKK